MFLTPNCSCRSSSSWGPLAHDARLDDLPGRLTVVDGTELAALAQLAGSILQGRDIKLHTHFEPLTGVTVDMDLTAAHGSEIDHLLGRLLPDRVYVQDRGYACFRLFQGIIDRGSHFVVRARDNSVYEVIEDRPLSAAARAADMLSDQIVRLGSAQKRDELETHIANLQATAVGPAGMIRRPLSGGWMLCRNNPRGLPLPPGGRSAGRA